MNTTYIGEEVKIVDGKMTTERTKQEQMSKNRGKIPQGIMYRTDTHWALV